MNTEKLIALSSDDKLSFKQRFVEHCIADLSKRIVVLHEAVEDAQESANNEDKSPMGDRHETARALSQNTRDINAAVLAEALREQELLVALNEAYLCDSVIAGAIVVTPLFVAFVSTNLGKMEFEGYSIMCISPGSPVAQKMLKMKKGDKFAFNNLETVILEVF